MNEKLPEGWSRVTLKNLCDIVMGQSPLSSSYNQNGRGIPLVQGLADTSNGITKPKVWTSKPTKVVPKLTTLMSVRAPVGAIVRSDSEVNLGRGMCGFIPKSMNIEQFLFHVLNFSESQWQIVSQGSTFTAVNKFNVEDFEILMPDDHYEQKAIAEALSDIDELISISNKLVSKKSGIYTALISQILLGEYFDLNNLAYKYSVIGDLEIRVDKGDLITEKTAIRGDIPVVAGGISAAYFHNAPNRWGITVTISASGANAGFVNVWRQDIWASDCSTISESDKYDIRYLFHILKGKQEEIYRSQYGGAQPHVRPNEIRMIEIPWVEKRYQVEIANTLEDLTDEIQAINEEIKKYEWLKQGMMDDLLTGKVRLV